MNRSYSLVEIWTACLRLPLSKRDSNRSPIRILDELMCRDDGRNDPGLDGAPRTPLSLLLPPWQKKHAEKVVLLSGRINGKKEKLAVCRTGLRSLRVQSTGPHLFRAGVVPPSQARHMSL